MDFGMWGGGMKGWVVVLLYGWAWPRGNGASVECLETNYLSVEETPRLLGVKVIPYSCNQIFDS